MFHICTILQKDRSALKAENRGLKFKYDDMKKQASRFKKERDVARMNMTNHENTIGLLQQQVQLISSHNPGYLPRQPAPVIYGMQPSTFQPKMATKSTENDSVESIDVPEYIKQ